MIRNDNPDKGTETVDLVKSMNVEDIRLEMITPIRGRKQTKDSRQNLD